MSLPAKPTHKQVERRQFDRFVEISRVVPEGEVVQSEEPDFLVHSRAGVLGVEVTDLYWQQNRGATRQQEIESLRARIAEAAGRQYSACKLPALDVSVHFNPSYVPKKKDVPRLSEAIAKLVKSNVPGEGANFQRKNDCENTDRLPAEISLVSAWRHSGLEHSFFTSAGAAFIPVLAKTDIERVLAPKESKLKR